MRSSATLIVMADSRDPIAPSLLGADYFSLAAAVNLDYARRHGYDFRFYRFGPAMDVSTQRGDPDWRQRLIWLTDRIATTSVHALSAYAPARRRQVGVGTLRRYSRWRRKLLTAPTPDGWEATKMAACCEHPTLGPRSAPWCKLLALRHALADDYERIVYIDSDAVFASTGLSLDAFLERAQSATAPAAEADLVVLCNAPWTEEAEACSGFMVWRNSPAARAMLERWWDTDAGRYHASHDYEQRVLNHVLLADPGCRARIAVLPELSLLEHQGQLVRHVASPHAWARVPRFRLAAIQAGIDEPAFASLMRALREQHVLAAEPRAGATGR